MLRQTIDPFETRVLLSDLFSEIMYEDTEFKDRQLAALVASKVRLTQTAGTFWMDEIVADTRAFSLLKRQVYYHLGEFDDSLNFALGAGALFDLSSKSEYVDTIICK